MGIVINQRAQHVQFAELLVQLDIVRQADAIRLPPSAEAVRVVRGGPVDTGRGFVLHSSDYRSGESTVKIAEGVCLTATLEHSQSDRAGRGAAPRRARTRLCGLGVGAALESEILANAWLVGPMDASLIFDLDFSAKYDRALALLRRERRLAVIRGRPRLRGRTRVPESLRELSRVGRRRPPDPRR